MTTTTNRCGLGDDEKPSSRVLQPPGGGSSDIFGTSQSTVPVRTQLQQKNASSNIFGVGEDASPQHTQKQTNRSTHSNIFGAEPHVIAGKGRNQSKFDPITGRAYDTFGSPADSNSEKQQTSSSRADGAAQSGQGDVAALQAAPGKAQAVHTTSRVLNPPGGHTHKLW